MPKLDIETKDDAVAVHDEGVGVDVEVEGEEGGLACRGVGDDVGMKDVGVGVDSEGGDWS